MSKRRTGRRSRVQTMPEKQRRKIRRLERINVGLARSELQSPWLRKRAQSDRTLSFAAPAGEREAQDTQDTDNWTLSQDGKECHKGDEHDNLTPQCALASSILSESEGTGPHCLGVSEFSGSFTYSHLPDDAALEQSITNPFFAFLHLTLDCAHPSISPSRGRGL